MGKQFKTERDRAEYWKQRAKSAEGHLFASDFKAAVTALHACTNFESTPWDELSGCQLGKLYRATGSVIRVVNARRCARAPKDSDAEEVIRALTAELDKASEEYDKAWRHDLNDKKNYQVLAAEVARIGAERELLRNALNDVFNHIECNTECLVRDLVNWGTPRINPNDFYTECEAIKAIASAALNADAATQSTDTENVSRHEGGQT
jgi:hypothetical protein